MAEHKLALVLSGGGMGGAAHLGAIKALEEYSLIPEAVLGTSIGAFVGSVYASGATPAQMIAGWQKISRMNLTDILDLDSRSIRLALTRLNYRYITGFLLGQALMRMQTDNYVHIQSFPELTRLSATERQAKNVKAFYAVAANLIDSRETIFCDPTGIPLDKHGLFEGRRLCGHVSFVDAVRASFSLPAIFTPHPIYFPTPPQTCPCVPPALAGRPSGGPDHHLYIDGSVKDDFPITIAAKLAKADKIIGINLTKAGAKTQLSLTGGLPEIQQRVMKIIGDDQYEADRYDKDVARADLITIDPAIGEVGVFDMQMGDWLIERGYRAVKECFAQKRLDPALGRAENLRRLFPPVYVDHCPECSRPLESPLDLGSDEQFIARLPDHQPPQSPSQPAQTTGQSNGGQLLRHPWGCIIAGLVGLFALGGLQIWGLSRLITLNITPNLALWVIIGGLVFVIMVLAACGLIGWWLLLLLKNAATPASPSPE